jgi:2-C-methyl-D-erythritol 4-phosphate cytidylyltransferase
MKDVSVLVLAAGSGSRLGEPKQFLELKPGVRLVDLAVESALGVTDEVVLVLPDGFGWDGLPVSSVVMGGATRLESVAAGLAALPREREIVVVHDAAHPLAPKQAFHDVIEAVRSGAEAAVPFLPAADVIKRMDHRQRLSTVGRDGLGLAQVPMAFSANALRSAHEGLITNQTEIWEDAGLIELTGGTVVGVDGWSTNIHIVTEEDLELARSLANQRRCSS